MNLPEAIRSEGRLVLRAQTGEVAAWDALLSATQAWLHAYLRRLLNDTHLADEVLQEVFLLTFRKLRFLHEPLAYRAWVYRIASRQAFRHIKREQKHSGPMAGEEHLDANTASAPSDPPDPDLLDRIRGKVQRLPPNTRAVFVLHYYEGMSIRQTADVLDLSNGTVKSRLAYGLARLREQVTEDA